LNRFHIHIGFNINGISSLHDKSDNLSFIYLQGINTGAVTLVSNAELAIAGENGRIHEINPVDVELTQEDLSFSFTPDHAMDKTGFMIAVVETTLYEDQCTSN
jgi:hypothetical protein